MRTLALINAIVVCLLATSVATGSAAAPIVLAAAAAITVSGNGLAFTTVAELAGRRWSGRAVGTQNTVQQMVAIGVPPLFGLLITAIGYASAFLLAAGFAAAATFVVPVPGRGKFRLLPVKVAALVRRGRVCSGRRAP
jgi:MFS family permease